MFFIVTVVISLVVSSGQSASFTVKNITKSGVLLSSSSASSWNPNALPSAGDDLLIDLSAAACANQDAFEFVGGSPVYKSVVITSTPGWQCLTVVYVVGLLRAESLTVNSHATLVLGSREQTVSGAVSVGSFTLGEGALLQGSGVITTTSQTILSGYVVPGRRLNRDCPLCHPLFVGPNKHGVLRFANSVPVQLSDTNVLAIHGNLESFDKIDFTRDVVLGNSSILISQDVNLMDSIRAGGIVSGPLGTLEILRDCCQFDWEKKCSACLCSKAELSLCP